MFYKQIVPHKGIPFEVSLPAPRPINLTEMSSAELSEELEKGYTDMIEERAKSAKDVFASIRKDYAL